MALCLELFALVFALLAGTVGGNLHLALAVAGVATIPAVEALGAETPDALAAEIAICGNLERLALKVMVLRTEGDVADSTGDGGGLDLGGEALAVDGVQILLQGEEAADDLDLVLLLGPLADALLETLD